MSTHSDDVRDRPRSSANGPEPASTRRRARTREREDANEQGSTHSERGGRVDALIRHATAAVVVLVASVAAYVSYQHAYDVARSYGEGQLTARMVPLTVDGLVFASSMVLLYCARHSLHVPALARWTLALGIAATLAANVAHGIEHGPVGAGIAAWPAVALVLSYELLMWLVRIRADTSTSADTAPAGEWDTDTNTAETIAAGGHADTRGSGYAGTATRDPVLTAPRIAVPQTPADSPNSPADSSADTGTDNETARTVDEDTDNPADNDEDKLAAARALAAQLHLEGHRITRKALREGTPENPGITGSNTDLTNLAKDLRAELDDASGEHLEAV